MGGGKGKGKGGKGGKGKGGRGYDEGPPESVLRESPSLQCFASLLPSLLLRVTIAPPCC